MAEGWIGVDLDGTLAYYDHWRGEDHIGDPIPEMAEAVKHWVDQGKEVRIMTARASEYGRSPARRLANIMKIQGWCEQHVGASLRVTSDKDFNMVMLWDDRCKQVIPNKGIPLEAIVIELREALEALCECVDPDTGDGYISKFEWESARNALEMARIAEI